MKKKRKKEPLRSHGKFRVFLSPLSSHQSAKGRKEAKKGLNDISMTNNNDKCNQTNYFTLGPNKNYFC